METLRYGEILKAVNGKLIKKGNEERFIGVTTDSRNINKDEIFFALKGENFNGNEYIKEASTKGASLCIVDEIKFNDDEIHSYTTVIMVKDCRRALLDLAQYYRSKLNIKIIGITGSTGKTTTKDLTAAVLSSKYKVFKTKGNYNNEIGLPLMIFRLDNTYDAAVLEMGMSDFGEIHNLTDVARPDIAIITNIGISHIETLKTRENILKAKLEIIDFFDKNNVLIVNADNDMLEKYSNDKNKIIKIGTKNGLNFTGSGIITNGESIKFTVEENKYQTKEEFLLSIPGKHNILNSLLAIACGREMGLTYDEIKRGIVNLQATSMRLDIKKGKKFTIINDCYNASPDSMIAAIDVLEQIKGKRKIALLGTMKELGDEAYNSHCHIGKYLRQNKIDLLITLGKFNNAYSEGFDCREKHIMLNSFDEVVNYLKNTIEIDDVVLVKASRSMKFENIVKELEGINC